MILIALAIFSWGKPGLCWIKDEQTQAREPSWASFARNRKKLVFVRRICSQLSSEEGGSALMSNVCRKILFYRGPLSHWKQMTRSPSVGFL